MPELQEPIRLSKKDAAALSAEAQAAQLTYLLNKKGHEQRGNADDAAQKFLDNLLQKEFSIFSNFIAKKQSLQAKTMAQEWKEQIEALLSKPLSPKVKERLEATQLQIAKSLEEL